MSLLNKASVREHILSEVKRQRPGWNCTRVSPKIINQLESKLDSLIVRAVQMHPTIGQTFKEMML